MNYGFGKQKQTQKTQEERTYLYVPIKYKDNFKKFDGKFDIQKKMWYILNTNEHYDVLCKLFKKENFSYKGEILKIKLHSIPQEYKEILNKVLEKNWTVLFINYKDRLKYKNLGILYDTENWFVLKSNANYEEIMELYEDSDM